MNNVSIMLITYNRLPLTQRMFESFFKTVDNNYHLIIVDNGSTDGTVEWLKQFKPNNKYCQGVEIYFNSENKGIAIGRNQALLIANKYQDPWLCTIDNDIEFPNNWLSQCLNIVKTNHKFAIGLNFEGVNYPLQLMNGKPVQWKKEGNLGTACSLFHRKLHQAIGFFNMDYGSYGEEDADYYFRARQAGWSLGYLPTNAIHFGEGELDKGEYRDFKTAQHKKNLQPFQANCHQYMAKTRSIYIPFEDNNLAIKDNR